jgi:hypothetical protein
VDDGAARGSCPRRLAAGRCAVIPRIPFTSSPADIALRAFLDHPIVLYGHHDDIADGLEALAQMAAAVNRLGGVRWMSSGDIALSNVARRSAEGVLELRAFARRVRATVPGGGLALRIAVPDDADDAGALAGWSAGGGAVVALGESLRVDGASSLLVRLHARHEVDPHAVAPPLWRPWPRVRRSATEARDRVSPLLARRAA